MKNKDEDAEEDGDREEDGSDETIGRTGTGRRMRTEKKNNKKEAVQFYEDSLICTMNTIHYTLYIVHCTCYMLSFTFSWSVTFISLFAI